MDLQYHTFKAAKRMEDTFNDVEWFQENIFYEALKVIDLQAKQF